MTRRALSALVVLGSLGTGLLLVGVTHGCGSSGSEGPEDAIADAGQGESHEASVDAKPDTFDSAIDTGADVTVDHDAGCFVRPAPNMLRDWEPWTGYSCRCPLYVPGDKVPMPEPIVWQKCPEPSPSGIDCRSMKITWGPKSDFSGAGGRDAYWYDEKRKTPMLLYPRTGFPGLDHEAIMYVVADVDGPVHNAIVRNSPNGACAVLVGNIQDGAFVLNLFGDDDHDPQSELDPSALPQGQIGGVVGEKYPKVLDRQSRGTIATGNSRIFTEADIAGHLDAYTWDKSWHERIWPQGHPPRVLPAWKPIIGNKGDDIFFEVSGHGLVGLMSWTKQEGTRPLRRWYNDFGRGAGNLGTDGKDMVWVEGTRPNEDPQGSYQFDHVDVMTAPYTTDPAVLEKTARRLRSSVDHTVGYPKSDFVVGCGYGARATRVPSQLRIIRLSDGRAWTVDSVFLGPNHSSGDFWFWGKTLGVTCDEVFVSVGFHNATSKMGSESNIARVRLDSLGAGEPAD